MVNTLHLSSNPGISLIQSLDGVHRFMGWEGPVASDSGGFQLFSWISDDPSSGRISSDGFQYRLDKGGKKNILTPEKCIQKQFQLGADLMFCLDHCTHPESDPAIQRNSVENTVNWARRCKTEFTQRAQRQECTPLLYGIIQGGEDLGLRNECAEKLLDLDLDGFGFGGWPINSEGGLVEAVAHVAELVPKELPKHALGIGKPENVLRAFSLGYHTFDCTIPTRDARRERLYVLNTPWNSIGLKADSDFYRYLYIGDEKHARDGEPIDPKCNCLCCRKYSRAYLHHLFRLNDSIGLRLATLHNLTFYGDMMERLRVIGFDE